MKVSASVQKMIATVKRELKSRGCRYRDVAAQLNVSETTVKRYLSGRGITIEALEKLAGLVDLDLMSLAALTQQQASSGPGLNRAQHAALIKEKRLRAVYFFLLKGWSLSQIANEFEISDIETLLVRLESLNLIRRFASGGIRILARPNQFGERHGGTFGAIMIDGARKFLAEIDLRDAKCEWMYYAVRIHRSSAAKLQGIVRHFLSELKALDESQPELSPQDAQWYRVFAGAMPVIRQRILRDGSI